MTYAVLRATCQSDGSENVLGYQYARHHCWLTEQWGTNSCPVVAETSVPEAVTLGNWGLVCVMCLLKFQLRASMPHHALPHHATCLWLALNQLSQYIFGFISICAVGVMPPLQLPLPRVLAFFQMLLLSGTHFPTASDSLSCHWSIAHPALSPLQANIKDTGSFSFHAPSFPPSCCPSPPLHPLCGLIQAALELTSSLGLTLSPCPLPLPGCVPSPTHKLWFWICLSVLVPVPATAAGTC